MGVKKPKIDVEASMRYSPLDPRHPGNPIPDRYGKVFDAIIPRFLRPTPKSSPPRQKPHRGTKYGL